MTANLNIFSLTLLTSGVGTLILSLLLFLRVKGVGRYFGFMMMATAVWAITYGIELSLTSLADILQVINFQYLGIALLPASWVLFILKFLGKNRYLNKATVTLIFLIPVLTLVLVWTNGWHHLHYERVSLVSEGPIAFFHFTKGPWYYLFTAYFYAMLAAGMVLLLRKLGRADSLYRRQKQLIFFGALIPWISNISYVMGYRPYVYMDLTPFAFILTSLIVAFGLLKFKLFDLLPVAREKIIEALGEGVLVVNENARIIDLNPKMEHILGSKAARVIGEPFAALFPNKELNQQLRKQVNGEVEITLPKGAAEGIFAVTISHLAGEKGLPLGSILLFKDITDRKEAELTLTKAKEEAEHAAEAQAQFLSIMSHEIRTPMNAILGFTHLLLQNDPRQDQKEFLDIQRFSAESLLVLINDILDFTKIEAGKLDFEETEIDLAMLLHKIYASQKPRAQEKGIQLKLLYAPGMPRVLGDPVRITQILTNLISNAIKFTEEGRVTVEADLLHQDSQETTVAFEVRDTGIGIPADKLEQVFESFTQASTNTTRKFGGTGLGLTITKQLLTLLNSQISVESEIGQGSVFAFTLTFKNSASPFTAEMDVNAAAAASLKGRRVLLVEDNPVNVLLASQFLKKWQIDFQVALDGRQALQQVGEREFDLILMDLQMPEMDGYTAARQIRTMAAGKYQALPIIALSASAMEEVRQQVQAAGMNDYITKPFNPDDLFKKLARYLS